jgi:superfamily II DNA/RNA helicase
VTFVTDEEGDAARDIEKRIGRKVEWIGSDAVPTGRGSAPQKAPQQQRSRGGAGRAQGRSGQGRTNSGSNAPQGQKSTRQDGGDRSRREVGDRPRGSTEQGRRGQSQAAPEGGSRSRNRRRGGSRQGSSSPSQGRAAEEKPNLIGRIWNRLKGGRP